MSDLRHGRTLRLGIWSAALAMLIPQLAMAQSTEEYRRQVERLLPEWRAAERAVDSLEAARRSAARSMSIERGSLRIVADSAVAHFVTAAAEVAAPQIEATFGSRARLLAEHPITVRLKTEVRRGDTNTVIALRSGNGETTVSLDDPAVTHDQLVGLLRGTNVVGWLHRSLDDTLRGWFGAALPVGRQGRPELSAAYVDLVTGSTDISRRCLDGEVIGCRQLLLLSPSPDPIVEGLTAAQRRAIVRSNPNQLRTGGRAAEYDRCVTERDDAACLARLRDLPAAAVPRNSISPTTLRRSFARSVLERDSAGYERLAGSVAMPLDARFAAAGGAPVDSLIMAWRASVLAARPRPSSVNPAAALATLGWIVFSGALALRSTRWR